ncbi:MAG: ABC transporter permease [Acidimicrobiia bacterium]
MIWFREIWRSKLKFLLLAAAIGLLFFLLVFVNTLSTTLLGSFIGALEGNSADVLVYDAESQATIPASRLTPDDVEAVGSVDGVAVASPISVLTSDVDFGGQQLDMSLWGIDPQGPGSPVDLLEGDLPAAGQAVVDTSARDEGFRIGSSFEIRGVTVEVVGVADNATYSVLPTAYLPNETFSEVFLGVFPQAPAVPINMIGVRADAAADPVDVAASISRLDGLVGLSPSEAAASTPGVSSIQQSFGIITGITFVIVILVVGFFFQILTVQKLNVFTLLRAVGARTKNVVSYVFGQIGFLVLLGVLIGVALLVATAAGTREFFAIDLDPVLISGFGAAILLASLLSGLTSIRRIGREDPAAAATGEQN